MPNGVLQAAATFRHPRHHFVFFKIIILLLLLLLLLLIIIIIIIIILLRSDPLITSLPVDHQNGKHLGITS